MANDEVSRAYAEYMGTSSKALAPYGQQHGQYCGQPYYYPVAPVGPLAPVAPTPPPAAPAVVYEFHQSMRTPKPPGYREVLGSYAEKPAIAAYSVGWQYTDPLPPPPMSAHAPSAKANISSTPSSRSASGEVLEAQSKSRERWHYFEYEHPALPPPTSPPPAPPERPEPAQTAPTPVLLCHTCRVCNRMRSAGFHRTNPVIPGKPLISGVCRRCKKKRRKSEEYVRRVTHTRTCTADEPCDWPDRSVRIQIGGRGRPRSRSYESDEVYVERCPSRSRPRVIKRSESRSRLGLRVLQAHHSPPRILRRKTEVRYSSMSPPRETFRVRGRVSVPHEDAGPAPPFEYVSAMPPPEDGLPHPSLRDRAQSISPARYRAREDYHSHDAVNRIASHPTPYRSILPDQRSFQRNSSEDYFDPLSVSHTSRPARAPSQGILKSSGMDHETSYRRRMSMRGSQESTTVEVGGPRVQFAQNSLRGQIKALPESSSEHFKIRTGRQDLDGQFPRNDYFDYYHRRAGATTQYLDNPTPPPRPTSPTPKSPSPPTRAFEEIRIRHVSPQPLRGRSPPGRLPIDYRYVPRPDSPPPPTPRRPHPPKERVSISYRTGTHRSPHSPDRIPTTFRRFPRPTTPESASSPPMVQHKQQNWEEVTTTDSDASGEVVKVQSWRGVDENGEPATFIEERVTRYVSSSRKERDEERGGCGRFAGAGPMRYRDV